MRLQRLEISGFKSFPDRADLAFDDGVTAIVGPNGCGKSNVVDAITWVLGEQSAKSLRGERMEDVIFGGSDARKPNATAEVRLRLAGVPTSVARRTADRLRGVPPAGDPVDGNGHEPEQIDLPAVETRDVELARRLYRSGESEYLLDGEVCRLRDIQDLLMDAGVGVKGYAVIEQGKIGQILSAKPTDRRQLIEEAAGVTKYKSRRRAAELKLDAAQQNLARVDDIIFEIEKQRGSLRRQAGKARRYRRLREELRRWEKVLFARRHRALVQAIDLARARLADARAREASAAAAVDAVEQALGAARRGVAAADGRLVGARDAAHQRELENGRRQQQLAFDRQQVETLTTTAAELTQEIAALEARREPTRAELDTRRGAATEANAARDDAAARLAEHQQAARDAQQRVEALESDIEAARGRVYACQTAQTTLRHAIERATEARARLADEIARLDAEASDLAIERERATAERQAASAAFAAVQQAIEGLKATRTAREATLAALRADRSHRQESLRAHERELAATTARLRSLEELDAAREGYGDAARFVLQARELGVTHFGSVADYVETAPRYERAVEGGLGELLQYIVVEQVDDALRALDAVRAQAAGRCGFVVADARGGSFVNESAAPVAGLVPLASVVSVGGPFAGAIREAIGELWLAETIDEAAAAAPTTRAPIVTLGGEIFRGGLLVSGGTREASRGILATKREIKELRDRLGGEQHIASRLALELADVEQAIGDAEQAILAIGAELHGHDKAGVGHQLEVGRAGADLDRLGRRLDLCASERRRAEQERALLDEREQESREGIARLEAEWHDLDGHFAALQRDLAGARERAAALALETAETRASHAAFVERAAAVAIEVQRLDEAARDLDLRLEGRRDELARNASRRDELARAIVDNERALEEGLVEFERLQAAVTDLEGEVSRLLARVEEEEAARQSARLLLDEVRAAVSQEEVARVTAESDLQHLATSCSDALQMSIEEVVHEVEQIEQAGEPMPDAAVIYGDDEEEDGAEDAPAAAREPDLESAAAAHAAVAAGLEARALTAEEAIAGLRAKIDRLGPVNMMAIEQFDELEERHRFLTGQRQDLVDSIAATGEAIKRIDKTTRERFREAFAAINTYFEETFTTLFGGGRAGLVLLDEDDLLESGIDIIAQPPGKRLQNVQLLSGGEKALSAMALMFAIFRYRPSPFCLLDEIDAPLDETNIGRFLEMLYGMLDRTQFIIITHSRKTMEMADRLYGVTMEEPGVSKLISLQLN